MAEKSGPPTRTAPGDTPADVAAGVRTPRRSDGPRVRPKNGLDRYFEISARRSTVTRELRGGLTTFFTMAYIVILNPIILSGTDITGGSLPFASIAAVTALIAGVMTILMGVVGRYPFAVAAGLGINAIVAVFAATQLTWPEIMGLVVLEGLLITVLVLTGFRRAVFEAIPPQLKTAIAVGIGFFLTIIGLADAGVIRPGSPLISFGVNGQLAGWPLLVFVVGLLLTSVLVVRRVKGALLIGIVASTLLAIVVEEIADIGVRVGADNPRGWALQLPRWPDEVISAPDLSLVGNFSLFGGFERIGVVAALLIVFSIMIADFFDTVGTVTAVGAEGDLLDEKGNLPKSQPVLLVDSLAAAAGGAGSVSSNTTYVESTAGVADGARTGLASVATGVLFLLAMFFTPLVQIVPSEAAAPALVIVGALMISQIRNLEWDDMSLVIPAFLTIALMPFTYSITNGIGAGVISYVLLRSVVGRRREVHPLMWVIAVLFLVYFALEPLQQLF
ncbi:NCS2 family permease [Geodermatophilus sabuli]|uniref:Putative MFS transporter, AGZA family, xanthine/uracil permease n=1 Tax=Geodermatophilus sabuli TaxID=1564158 RepID=A0A285EFF8_9ACTN|nr:NCS2 family permease [Geodermatophilus sabuli]MBB3083335.1 AGZA family xanthine/uracil permease-like MFS transporter [Geodermatophilus sabuli]SNX96944.1 putative MFS transporter, AGZA family, xanthine/uracil permease [Geodermatophilus sabuli]